MQSQSHLHLRLDGYVADAREAEAKRLTGGLRRDRRQHPHRGRGEYSGRAREAAGAIADMIESGGAADAVPPRGGQGPQAAPGRLPARGRRGGLHHLPGRTAATATPQNIVHCQAGRGVRAGGGLSWLRSPVIPGAARWFRVSCWSGKRLPPTASLTVRFRHAQPVQSAFAAVTETPEPARLAPAPCICVRLPELVSPQGRLVRAPVAPSAHWRDGDPRPPSGAQPHPVCRRAGSRTTRQDVPEERSAGASGDMPLF